MQTLFKKTTAISLAISFVIVSTGLVGVSTPQTARAQVGDIVSFVVDGRQVLDGCQGITGSRYEAIAAQLGIDLQGGIRGGLSALGDELGNLDGGGALLGGLQGIGSALADSAIGEAVGSLGSSIGDVLGNIGGGILSSIPGLGSVLGGVVGGLFGGGGPEEVVEEGLRKIQQEGQKIMLFEQRKITQKERCLDALAQKSGQAALRNLTNQSVTWLQEEFDRFGRDGNPGFVEDLERFISDVSENEFANFVHEAEGENAGSFSSTCNFLRRPILESVTTNYLSESGLSGLDDLEGEFDDLDGEPGYGGGCALTEEGISEAEAEAFLAGDFSAGGGWGSFARSARNPGSSPIGAYLQQQQEVSNRIDEAQEREQEQLQWGQGFLADSDEGGFTPGSVVQGITERIFTSDISRLELIDEMGEVAGEFGSTLIGQITGSGSSEGGGLSSVTGQESVGGDIGERYEYLSRSLTDQIVTQLEIEESVQEVLLSIVPLYQDDRVDELVSGARSCLEAGHLSDTNADTLLANTVSNLDTFRNTVLQNRVKVDWLGNEFTWEPVIKEEQQKKIGWPGGDYDWETDEVDRYYNQGTDEGCETLDDVGNASYIITEHVVEDPEDDFMGVFEDLEPTEGTGSEVYEKPDGSLHAIAEDGGIHKMWQKEVCTFSFSDGGSVGWSSNSVAIDDIEFEDTQRAQEKKANAQCELIDYHYVCVAPAYRAPQIITGDVYKENRDDEIESSSCNSRSDAGDHYFVSGGDDTWSIRECLVRRSPQGSAVVWESGFPESAETTDIPAYTEATTDNPVADQADLVAELDDMLTQLEDEDADVLDIQEDFYTLQDRFNSESAASALQRETSRFVENIRDLNQLVLEDDECTAGVESLSDFGSDFTNSYNPDSGDDGEEGDGGESPTINSFNAQQRTGTSFVSISWDANASSCEASSSPTISGWSGPVGTGGVQVLSAQDFGVNLVLTCERGGEEVNATQFVAPAEDDGGDGGGGFVPEEDIR